jgi:autotransporter adhesin
MVHSSLRIGSIIALLGLVFFANGAIAQSIINDTGKLPIDGDAQLIVNGEIAVRGNQITNVGDPVSGTDAVNLRTLEDKIGGASGVSSGGVAQSMAMTQLPYPTGSDTNAFGFGLGTFQGEGAIAMGGTSIFDNGTILRGAISHSRTGGTGAAAGLGWSW